MWIPCVGKYFPLMASGPAEGNRDAAANFNHHILLFKVVFTVSF